MWIMRVFSSSLIMVCFLAAAPCFGEWAQTIHCPAGHVYRDIRHDAGREEFCELVLPGLLVLKDGPYRSWLSEGYPSGDGNYLLGRETGKWKECNRFNRCENKNYDAAFIEEKKRNAFRPEVPVAFQNGSYRFDFASCRSTWITQALGKDSTILNIGGSAKYNCVISIFPESLIENGTGGSYTCWVPYAVGIRTFDTLDLMSELPKAGLPQFCRTQKTSPEPLMIRSGTEVIAQSGDLVCATLDKSPDGSKLLRIELNSFVMDLVRNAAKVDGHLNTLLCLDQVDRPQVAINAAGKVNLSCKLSTDQARARRQQKCIHDNLKAPGPCNP